MPQAYEIPTGIRVLLTHASLQALAELHQVRLLHLKGPAVAPGLRAPGKVSQDADVLVHPADMERFVRALSGAGWRLLTDFEEASAFGHAANYHHAAWGVVDVHRLWPGFERPAAEVFERLWERRGTVELAEVSCPTPDRIAQVLILVTHEARSHTALLEATGARYAWDRCTEAERAQVEALAEELAATNAMLAGLGRTEEMAPTPSRRLWQVYADSPSSRIEEWQARFEAEPTLRGKAMVLRRMLVPSRGYYEWGGAPMTRAERLRVAGARLSRAAREAYGLVRRRWDR